MYPEYTLCVKKLLEFENENCPSRFFCWPVRSELKAYPLKSPKWLCHLMSESLKQCIVETSHFISLVCKNGFKLGLGMLNGRELYVVHVRKGIWGRMLGRWLCLKVDRSVNGDQTEGLEDGSHWLVQILKYIVEKEGGMNGEIGSRLLQGRCGVGTLNEVMMTDVCEYGERIIWGISCGQVLWLSVDHGVENRGRSWEQQRWGICGMHVDEH